MRLVCAPSAGELRVEHPDAGQHRRPGPRPPGTDPQLSTASHGLSRCPTREAPRLRSPTTHEHRSDECAFLVADCWPDVLVSDVLERPARPRPEVFVVHVRRCVDQPIKEVRDPPRPRTCASTTDIDEELASCGLLTARRHRELAGDLLRPGCLARAGWTGGCRPAAKGVQPSRPHSALHQPRRSRTPTVGAAIRSQLGR